MDRMNLMANSFEKREWHSHGKMVQTAGPQTGKMQQVPGILCIIYDSPQSGPAPCHNL